ncbi:MAG: hypothetical protein MMC33_007365 [Icmadophila ericetorum]|nr:hypothetical protein [Icmadophila ericetorum]
MVRNWINQRSNSGSWKAQSGPKRPKLLDLDSVVITEDEGFLSIPDAFARLTQKIKDVDLKHDKARKQDRKQIKKLKSKVVDLEDEVSCLRAESFSISARIIMDAITIDIDPECSTNDPRLEILLEAKSLQSMLNISRNQVLDAFFVANVEGGNSTHERHLSFLVYDLLLAKRCPDILMHRGVKAETIQTLERLLLYLTGLPKLKSQFMDRVVSSKFKIGRQARKS